MAAIPLAPIDRLIREAGAERVSDNASEAFTKFLEEWGVNIVKRSVELARHSGRKTITAKDIELATSEAIPGPRRPKGEEKSKSGLPIAPIERLMRSAGADRISEDARKALAIAFEDYTLQVARKASDFARHSGRKTVKAEDIKLALKQ